MATIETTQTGGRVVTYVRGRAFRFAPKAKRVMRRSVVKEQRRICVLSASSHRRLLWGYQQPCYGDACTHAHWTRDAVEQMVADGQMEWVEGSGKNVAAWARSRTWKPVRSGGHAGPTVLQLVVGG